MKTWIIVAKRTEMKVFEYANKKNSVVQYLTKLENPRGRLRPGDINADRPGVFSSLMQHGMRMVKWESPTERVAQEFAKKVVVFLEEARLAHKFDDLIVVSDPHFMGRLRGLFSKELHQMVSREVLKDLGTVTTQELKTRLWPETSASP